MDVVPSVAPIAQHHAVFLVLSLAHLAAQGLVPLPGVHAAILLCKQRQRVMGMRRLSPTQRGPVAHLCAAPSAFSDILPAGTGTMRVSGSSRLPSATSRSDAVSISSMSSNSVRQHGQMGSCVENGNV